MIIVSVFIFILPVICSATQTLLNKGILFTFELAGKWFIFSAIGLRLFIAGIKQTTDPAFTARQIFRIDSPDSFPIVREPGFANLCFGLVAIFSLFLSQWRIVSALAGGLYYGIAGLQHLIKKPAGKNEQSAMVTNVVIFLFLLVYFVRMF